MRLELHKARTLSLVTRDSLSKLAAKHTNLNIKYSALKDKFEKHEQKSYSDCSLIIHQVEQLAKSEGASRHSKE